MRFLSLVLIAAVASGCVRTSRDPATGKVDVDIESPTKKGEDWKTDLHSTGSMAGIGGTSRANVADGKTTATITVTGLMAGGTHPWGIYAGKCGSGGAIIGDRSAYPMLTVGSNGMAQSSAMMMIRLEEAAAYHVNVHQSASMMENIIACGNLSD